MTTIREDVVRVPGEPAWEVARLFPNQGSWSEEEYLALKGNLLVEYSQGCVEVLPMPTTSHQRIGFTLCTQVSSFVTPRALGTVLPAPLRVRLWPGKFREPDVVFMLQANVARIGEEFWRGADLVMEVVSDDDRRRDLETKRREYAQGAIAEYWIVDPSERRIHVLRLQDAAYAVHGEFGAGAIATSALLAGLAIEVDKVFATGG